MAASGNGFASALPGRFELRGKLGSGGMGVVYRALDRERGIVVALKTVQKSDGKNLYRFKREFRSLVDAHHRNLVTLYELHTGGEDWFYTMELVEGCSFIEHVRPFKVEVVEPLDATVSNTANLADETADTEGLGPTSTFRPIPQGRQRVIEGRLDLERLRDAIGQLADGVFALHRMGKIHRDLKPSNVLVGQGGRVVILDFGLAADRTGREKDHTHDDHAVGTPMYMSPEQAADVPLTEASDWYSVGVMLYEALTGRRPFEGRRSSEIFLAKHTEDPLPPTQLAPDVPDDLNDLCVKLLERDPRERPGGRHILAALGRSPSQSSTHLHVRAEQPFVGRRAELLALESAYRASEAHLSCALVHGLSGIGKSMLVRRFLESLAHEQVVVLHGRCYESELVPHKALDSVVDALTRALLELPESEVEAMTPRDIDALSKLFPVVKRVPGLQRPTLGAQPPDPQETRRRAFGALRYLLTKLSERGRVIIHIDDLQWGDADSAGFLRDLLVRLDSPPLLFIATYRRDEAERSPLVTQLLGAVDDAPEGRVHSIAVEGFDAEEAQELVDAVRPGSAAHEDLERLLEETGGSPLFLAELVRRVADASDASDGSDGSDGEAETGYTLERLLRERIERLGDDERALLEVAAVAGRPIAPRTLVAAAQQSGKGRALAMLRREHLLRTRRGDHQEERVETYHGHIRRAALDGLEPEQLRQVHRRIALALDLSEDADPARLVEHWIGAGERTRAGEAAMAAAVAAEETLAFHRAADLYRLAIEHREMEAEELRRAWGRAGHALCHAGRLDAAAKAFATAAKGAEPNERLEYSRLELEQILRRGHLQRGLERAGEVMHQVGSSIPLTKLSAITVILKNRARLRLTGLRYRERPLAALPLAQQRRLDVAWSVSSALAFVSPVSGRAMQMQFMWEALRSGVPRYVIKALCLEIGYLGLAGLKNRDRCEALRTRVLALADEMDEKQLYGTVEGGCGIASFMFGRFRESYERLTAGEKYLRDNAANARWEIDIIQVFQAGTLLYLGRFGELGRILPLYIREAEERGDVYATRGLQAWRGNRLWLALDQPDEALRRIEDVSIGDSGEFHLHHYYELVSRTCVDLYNEHGEAAHRRVSEAWPSIKRSQLLRVQSIRVEGWFLRGRSALARAKGESASERRALIAEALDASKRIERERLTWASTLASLLRAGCDRLAGAEDAAVDHLRRAIVDASEADMGAFEAVAQVRCGVAIGGDEGGRMVASATRRLEEESVGNPTALVNLLAPGC